MVAADIGFFVSHYLQHRVPFLWEFHKVHHSAEVLHPVTAYRIHPVDQAIERRSSDVAHTGLVLGAVGVSIGQPVQGLITGVGGERAHIRFQRRGFAPAPFACLAFVWPARRRLRQPGDAPNPSQFRGAAFGQNLGGVFSIWDRIMGTLYVPRGREQLEFGLKAGEHSEYRSLLQLYLLPLWKSALVCLRPLRWRNAKRQKQTSL